MNRVDPHLFGDLDDCWNIKIRADRLSGLADLIGFIRFEAMQRKPVFIGVDGDGADFQFRRGPKNANGNFTAICDQQFTASGCEAIVIEGNRCL